MATAVALPGITAVGAALLYAAGLIARAGELLSAGFSPQDVLPWVPLQQGLARGVALLVDPAVIYGFLAFAGGWLFQLLPDGPRTQQWRSQRLEDISTSWDIVDLAISAASDAGYEEEVAAARDRLDDVKKRMVAASNYDMDLSVRELRRAGHDVRAVAQRHGVGGEALAALSTWLGESKRPKERPWLLWAACGAGAVAMVWVLLVSELARLPAYAVIAIVVFVAGWSAIRNKPMSPVWWKPGIVCALAFFILGNAYLGAERLQRVETRLSTGKLLRGQLLAGPGTQSGTWYVSPRGHVIVAVPDPRNITISDSSEPGRFEGYSLWDAIRGRPRPGARP